MPKLRGGKIMCTCGQEGKAVCITYSIVRVRTHQCPNCGRPVREFELTVENKRSLVMKELERLHKTPTASSSSLKKMVMDYLERLVDKNPPNPEEHKSFRQRREDLWEKRFLKETLGDDYYA